MHQRLLPHRRALRVAESQVEGRRRKRRPRHLGAPRRRLRRRGGKWCEDWSYGAMGEGGGGGGTRGVTGCVGASCAMPSHHLLDDLHSSNARRNAMQRIRNRASRTARARACMRYTRTKRCSMPCSTRRGGARRCGTSRVIACAARPPISCRQNNHSVRKPGRPSLAHCPKALRVWRLCVPTSHYYSSGAAVALVTKP